MVRRGRHPRANASGRGSRPGGRPLPSGAVLRDEASRRDADPGAWPAPSQPDLVTDVRRILDSGGPLDLLIAVSTMVSLVDPCAFGDGCAGAAVVAGRRHGRDDELGLEALLGSFVGAELPETTALLAALAALAPDPTVRSRAGAEVDRRGHDLPAWVGQIAVGEPYQAVALSHARDAGEHVVVGLRVGPDHEITVSVHIVHDRDTIVSDAQAVAGPIGEVATALWRAVPGPGTCAEDITLGAARLRISDALARGSPVQSWPETGEWPLCRPLVEWVARLLPPERGTVQA